MGMQPGMESMEFYANNGMRPQMAQNGGGQGSSNHALQDYQMQLMLLEQQNKKRLLMARQEQDNVRPDQNPAMAGQPGFAPNMSPQGSRSGPSPNPSEQMKRGTPKMGQVGLPGSPMPDGAMPHGRGSPGAMNFNNNNMGMEMMQQTMKGVDGMPMGPNGMRPPSSHPNFNGGPVNAQQIEVMRAAQAQGRMPNGANWPQGPQGQAPGVPQPNQPRGQQQMGTPRAPNAAMPPPQNVPAASIVNNTTNGRPVSPAQSATAGTPQQSNKPAPAKKGKADRADRKVCILMHSSIPCTDIDSRNLPRKLRRILAQHHLLKMTMFHLHPLHLTLPCTPNSRIIRTATTQLSHRKLRPLRRLRTFLLPPHRCLSRKRVMPTCSTNSMT